MAQESQEEIIEKKPEDEEIKKDDEIRTKDDSTNANGNTNTNTDTNTSTSTSTSNGEIKTNTSSSTDTSTKSSFKFNAQAPEFVPSSHTQMAIAGYYYPYYNYLAAAGDGSGSDWIYVADQDQYQYIADTTYEMPNFSKNYVHDDLQQRIIKQVEYQFSGLSLLANESLVKQINKDPEGYVPISVIASTKKIKSLNTNHQMIAQALRSSTKLIVSNDGKKVKRRQPFTDRDKEELQSRTVIGENLPDDHSHQNLDKIFNVVGSVKTIRICHPQESNSSRSKSDYVFSNKLHALVEYESPAIAEKAVEKLNDERNWRKGLRVSLCRSTLQPKSVLKKGKSDHFDGCLDEEDGEAPTPEISEHPINTEHVHDNNAEESSVAVSKKGWGRGRGKGGRPRVQSHNGRGLLAPSPQLSNFNIHSEPATPLKQVTKGPRMPDGTRGFTMGRGKPILPTPPILARIASQ